MKTITETKTITVMKPTQETTEYTVYEAEDGLRFDTEAECREHEETIRLSGVFNKIKTADWHEPPLDMNLNEKWTSADNFEWFFPTSEEEIEAINLQFALGRYGYGDDKLTVKDINTWVCVDRYDTDVYTYDHALDYSMMFIRKMMDKFGYDVDFTKRKEM